ncbi:MAG: hypothetical protein RL769_571 [Pseudomonadota bacterium]|jgi:prepilin-type N-terminal cleavage/methylation domain-containing protein
MKICLKKLKTNKSAYSLLELSIVILIISILISGAMTMSVGTLNTAKNKSTQDKYAEIYKALGNFLLTNRRLPCPASLKKLKNSDSDYGAEVANCSGTGVYQSTTSTNLVYGAVPVKALGLANDMAEDAFESKLVYLIDKRFAVASDSSSTNMVVQGGSVGEQQNFTISLPSGNQIDSILFASYGLPNTSTWTINSSCHASGSLSIVQANCLGRNSCTVFSSNSVFGDPCPGIGKALAIRYSYSALNATSTFSTSPSTGIITITEKPAGVAQNATSDAILVLISLGANKAGAFNTTANTQNARSSDADELENDIANFVDGNPSTATFNNTIVVNSENSELFDDLVFFKTRNQIVNDFNAMFLIPCFNAGASFNNANAFYGNLVYASSSCASPNEDKRLSRKCEAFGNWVDVVRACP